MSCREGIQTRRDDFTEATALSGQGGLDLEVAQRHDSRAHEGRAKVGGATAGRTGCHGRPIECGEVLDARGGAGPE